MQEIKAEYIGEGLYSVYIDGEKLPVLCELERVAIIYEDAWEKEHSDSFKKAD